MNRDPTRDDPPASPGPPEALPPDSALGRAERVYRELRALLWGVLKRRDGGGGVARGTKLELRLRIDPFEDGPLPDEPSPERRFAEDLLARLGQAVDDEVRRAAPFPEGRVRCYWCGSFDCAHAAPSGPHAVFGGYSPTGLPQWPDLAAVALERRDPRIEDLYRDPPIPLALLSSGDDLTSAQLPEYGQRSGAYRVLGQVTVGYLDLPAGPRGERASVALTAQAVEVERGSPRVFLNTLGKLPDGRDLGRLLEEGPDSRLADALRLARVRLAEIRGGRRRRGPSRAVQAMAVLERLARNLDRMFRQETRRTKHAQRRHLERERPAAAALRDALAARPEEIYRDVRQSTWVILGPRCRVHFFNDLGQHVSSVVYPGETVRRRTSQGAWRAAPAASVQGFREVLARSAQGACP